ncbi:MAG: hypothetical protein IKF91_04240 [Bacilli bacterium]|nr:hypothetical protein [Bacilli bacterium]
MTDEELMQLSEQQLQELIKNTKLEIEKIKLQNLKKKIIINEVLNNN